MIHNAQILGIRLQLAPYFSPSADQVVHIGKFRRVLQKMQRLQNGDVIFVPGHLRHRQDQEVLLPEAQLPALLRRGDGNLPEFGGVDAHPRNILDPPRVHMPFGPVIVLLVDGDQHVCGKGQQPLRRIEQQPVDQRRPPEEVESVSRIDNLRPFLPGIPGRKPCQHGPHRGMAMDQVVRPFVNDPLQHPVGGPVFPLPGRPLKGDVEIGVTVRDLAICGIFIVIFRRHSRLPAHFLEHFQVGNMKLHHVGFHHGCHKQDLFPLHCRFPPFAIL